MRYKKMILRLLTTLLISLVIVQPSLSETICFKNTSSASKAASDLLRYDYCKQALPIVKSERDLLSEKDKENQSVIKNLNLQVNTYSSRSEEYRNLYTSTSNELAKEKESKPSRLTWFGMGVVTTAILIIVGIFAVK